MADAVTRRVRNAPAQKANNAAAVANALQGDAVKTKVKVKAGDFAPGKDLRNWATFNARGGVLKTFSGTMSREKQEAFDKKMETVEKGLGQHLEKMFKGKSATMLEIATASANYGENIARGWRP